MVKGYELNERAAKNSKLPRIKGMKKFFQIIFVKFLLKLYFFCRKFSFILVNLLINPKLNKKYGAQVFFLKHIKEGDSIIDIGCSKGDLTRLLASKASYIDAYDISVKSIEYAMKNNSCNNVKYFLQEANSVVDSCKKHYNVALISGLLTFVEKPGQFLKKLRNLADLILIRETKFDNEILALVGKDLGIVKSNWKEFTKGELVSLIINSGYIIVEDFDTYDMFFAAKPDK